MRARMTAIFGNATKGMRAANLGAVKFDSDDPLYVSTLRTTRCDVAGSFAFPRVPDGVWYVTSSIKWQGTSQVEGRSIMQRVDVSGGRLVKVKLPLSGGIFLGFTTMRDCRSSWTESCGHFSLAHLAFITR